MKKEENNISTFKSKNSRTSVKSNKNDQNEEIVKIEDRFYLTKTKYCHQHYNAYNGIDVKSGKWIVAYLKLTTNKFNFSKIKEEIKNSLSSKILWQGNISINKINYNGQVHEGLGPSLAKMFKTIKVSITPKQLLHLLLQLLKLLQKLSNHSYVSGQLSPQIICFDANPKKNDLYLLNCFSLHKKGEQIKPICLKYGSKGSHHGRCLRVKDDLQSIVYILVDLYLDQSLFNQLLPFQYEDRKNSLNLSQFTRSFPAPFVQFTCCVNDLNIISDFNFFYWKNYLSKILTPQIINNPFTWMLADRKNNIKQKEDGFNFIINTLVGLQLTRKLEIQQLIEITEDDKYKKQNIKNKIIKKIILKQIIN